MGFANFISLLRVATLPLIIYFIDRPFVALMWFLFAFVTDLLDGYVARDKVGSFLDPLADKVLLLGLLFYFTLNGLFNPVVFYFFVVRDVIIIWIRLLAGQQNIQIPVEKGFGKLVIYAQYGLVFSILSLPYFAMEDFILLFIILAIVLAVGSIGANSYMYVAGLKQTRGKELSHEKIVVLANKKASGYFDKYRRKLLQLFCKRRKAKIHYLPKTSNMYHGVQVQGDQIVIAGGDGSFESALNYKPFWNKSLGFFPLGRGNYFYSQFFRGKRFEHLKKKFQFREEYLDVMELIWDQGKVQTALMSLGVDAEAMRLSGRSDKAGLKDYFVAGAKAWMQAQASFNLTLLVDAKQTNLKNCVALTLAKVSHLGFNLRAILGQVKPDDGLVYGLAIVNPHNPVWNKLIRLWALIFAKFNLKKAPFLTLKGKVIKISSDKLFPIQAGGDFLGWTKNLEIKVIRKQKVLVV
jgi:CDP-diacylglycerol---glycerol-3-phosphate 3-phosphatidyltransferase